MDHGSDHSEEDVILEQGLGRIGRQARCDESSSVVGERVKNMSWQRQWSATSVRRFLVKAGGGEAPFDASMRSHVCAWTSSALEWRAARASLDGGAYLVTENLR